MIFFHPLFLRLSPSNLSRYLTLLISLFLSLWLTLSHIRSTHTNTHAVNNDSKYHWQVSLGNTLWNARTPSHLEIRYSRAAELAATTSMTNQQRVQHTDTHWHTVQSHYWRDWAATHTHTCTFTAVELNTTTIAYPSMASYVFVCLLTHRYIPHTHTCTPWPRSLLWSSTGGCG